MKKIFTITIALISCLCCFAYTLKTRVHTFISRESTVYFFEKQGLKKLDGEISKFEYDMTYMPTTDSVTVNFTIVSPNPADVITMKIGNGETEIEASSVQLLYHEGKGRSKYKIRSTAKVNYAQLKSLMQSNLPMCFIMTQDQGTIVHKAKYSDSQWKKEKTLFTQIIYMINK